MTLEYRDSSNLWNTIRNKGLGEFDTHKSLSFHKCVSKYGLGGIVRQTLLIATK